MQFSQYMSDWLYGDGGYYSQHRTIGKEGDFYTAVSASMFFGGCIAKRLIDTIESGFLSSTCNVVEIGAHKGYLLADMIQFIYTLKPKLLETLTFIIVEPFEENRMVQQSYFQDAFGEAITLLHVKSLSELTLQDAFFVANEIFDAFPCEVVKENQMLMVEESHVSFREMDENLKITALKYNINKGEVAVGYEKFAKEMVDSCSHFEFVTFDYGDRDSRNDFSLRVYADHQVYPFFALTHLIEDVTLREDKSFVDLFAHSDITYDVNFSHLIGAFEESGSVLHQFSSQMSALVQFGLTGLLEVLFQNSTEIQYKTEVNKIKTLIDPAFMGERFKMASFRKNKEEKSCN